MHVGPTSPGSRPKECDKLGIHTHLLSAVFQVTSVSLYFLWVMLWVLLYRSHGYITRCGAVEEGGGLAVRTVSIHLRPMEISNEQGVVYLHGALGVRKSRRRAGVETVSGGGLRGAGGNNIHSR